MKGTTYMALSELKRGASVEEIAEKYKISKSAVYKLAKKYDCKLPEPKYLSPSEKKERRKAIDKRKNQRKAELRYLFERPDIPMPPVPLVAAKRTGLANYNALWILDQSYKLEKGK